MGGLEVLETNRVLRLTRGGRLLPWLGPALRGLTARQFKPMSVTIRPRCRTAGGGSARDARISSSAPTAYRRAGSAAGLTGVRRTG